MQRVASVCFHPKASTKHSLDNVKQGLAAKDSDNRSSEAQHGQEQS